MRVRVIDGEHIGQEGKLVAEFESVGLVRFEDGTEEMIDLNELDEVS